jgi:hypothetical protein
MYTTKLRRPPIQTRVSACAIPGGAICDSRHTTIFQPTCTLQFYANLLSKPAFRLVPSAGGAISGRRLYPDQEPRRCGRIHTERRTMVTLPNPKRRAKERICLRGYHPSGRKNLLGGEKTKFGQGNWSTLDENAIRNRADFRPAEKKKRKKKKE